MASPSESFASDFSIVSAVGEGKSTHKYDRWGSAALYSVAALGMVLALQQDSARAALALTAFGFLAAVGAIALPPVKSLERRGDLAAVIVLGAVMVAELSALVPVLHATASAGRLLLFTVAVIAATNLNSTRWLGRWQIPLLCGAHAAFGVSSVLLASPATGPLSSAAALLASGANPYASGYRDLPLPVLLAAPFQLFLKNPTVALAVATTGAGAFLAYARPGRASAAAASTLMLLPQGFAALKEGGTEPFVLFLLCATVFCACRFPKVFPFVLGLWLATKVYLVLALPAVLVLASLQFNLRHALSLAWKALLAFAAVVLPFVLWNPAAFKAAVLGFEMAPDARAPTFLSWIAQNGGPSLPTWMGIVVALALLGLVMGRAARTPSGFAAGVALIYFGLFAFAPQATAAQYALVLGALFAAVAATGLPGTMDEAADLKSVYFKNS